MSAIAIKRFVAGALVASALVVSYLVLMSGSPGHQFSTIVPEAANLVPGNEVNGAGRKIGEVVSVEPVDRGRAARLTVRIDDGDYWPLSRDATIEIRFGGTVSFANRYLLLQRGTPGGPTIPEGGELPMANVQVPVELDTVLSQFRPGLREDVRGLLANGADVTEQAGRPLRRALREAPPVLDAAEGLLGDLGKDQQALATLVTSAGRVVDQADSASPGLRPLLTGLARTFDAVADEQAALRTTLTQLPAAMRQTRGTLAKARVTLGEAADLTDALAPGVSELRRIAAPLTGALTTLEDVTPGARDTIRAVDASDPTTVGLNRLASVVPRIGSIGRQAATQISCIRPYTPELIEFGTTWADWMTPTDNRDHLVRATVQNFLPANYNSVPQTAKQVVDANPGIDYGFPRPPGALAAQPWFQPRCGAGRDALDPSNDRESANFKQNQLPPEATTTPSTP